MITLGGDAELELVDSLDPFSEGTTTTNTDIPLCALVVLPPLLCTSHTS